jgi:phage tail sheath protein FI
MPLYHTPGVYFEWLETPRAGIDMARTDIAGFVGIAARGPLHIPVKIESLTQFASTFGDRIPQGYLAYAVEGFFMNGGGRCWVVRVADPATARYAALDLTVAKASPPLQLTASSPGAWANQLLVAAQVVGTGLFNLRLSLPNGTQEFWANLSMSSSDPRFVEALLNDELAGSLLVRVGEAARRAAGSPIAANSDTTGLLGQGTDGLASLDETHLSGEGAPGGAVWGIAALEPIREIAIVAAPDIMPKRVEPVRFKPAPPRCDVLDPDPGVPRPRPQPAPEYPLPLNVAGLQNALIGHCEKLKDRVAILDSRREDQTTEQIKAWHDLLYPSRYAGLYYPWIMTPDPLALEGLLRAIPPSGHVAGVYARTEHEIGVHKPPANERLQGAEDVTVSVDDNSHGLLNDAGVNVIRIFNGRQIRIGGARTLAALSDTQWIYVNVRRLLIMIERSIDTATQWTVFEPNSPGLWREVDRVVRGFLDRLWRRGFLDGARQEEAYQVKCDLTTNPDWEIANGRLTCEIGVLPPWPAEFVVVRIGRTASGIENLNALEAQDG